MLARSCQLLVLVACLIGVANANAGLVITEVMYSPLSDVSKSFGEWVEIYNDSPSSSAPIDLADYDLNVGSTTFNDTVTHMGIEYADLSGFLGAGEVAVLIDGNYPFSGLDIEDDFRAQWTLPNSVKVLPLFNWTSLHDSPDLTLLNRETSAENTLTDYRNSPWPDAIEPGQSITLRGLGYPNTAGGNWVGSKSLFAMIGSGSENEYGSPGFAPAPLGPPATVPEPSSLAIFAGLICGTVGLRRRRSRRES
ncbi:lamin tail domain-containing protein [Stieleria magnilauensis]|uniref:Ice-binding protein C-terminal domain-containing protein n=1 Tax=Stieleria magnilauensis TaxID=2527963 RepID=A0ABX5XQN8_9BACT|nr:hypothetical protein TBK1r_18680 [Planctomycetes bacterium TBK1r]